MSTKVKLGRVGRQLTKYFIFHNHIRNRDMERLRTQVPSSKTQRAIGRSKLIFLSNSLRFPQRSYQSPLLSAQTPEHLQCTYQRMPLQRLGQNLRPLGTQKTKHKIEKERKEELTTKILATDSSNHVTANCKMFTIYYREREGS